MAEGDSTKHIKIWKATDKSHAGFMVTERSAVMAATKNNFVVAHPAGVGIAGRSISFMTTSENIRQGGIFIQMNDLVRMIPQTLVTPNPSQVPYPPLGIASNILKDLPLFLGMLV